MQLSFINMYALSPTHVGSGASVGVVDLPIQRERHTNWPVIPSSGMKGAMREQFTRGTSEALADLIFGDSSSNGSKHAGAIVLSDAKILAFPMRSSVAPFVWITCPAVLNRLNKDLKWVKKAPLKLPELPADDSSEALVVKGAMSGDILLEDTIVSSKRADVDLGDYFPSVEKLLIVSNSVFDYGVSNCTSIQAHIKIESKTGTTKDGSLRYQEELPADTLMYTVLACGDSRHPTEDKSAAEIEAQLKAQFPFIQVGGDMTLGRGLFELDWK